MSRHLDEQRSVRRRAKLICCIWPAMVALAFVLAGSTLAIPDDLARDVAPIDVQAPLDYDEHPTLPDLSAQGELLLDEGDQPGEENLSLIPEPATLVLLGLAALLVLLWRRKW